MSPSHIRRRGLLPPANERFRDMGVFLVASEDTFAVEQYFDALRANGVFDTRRVVVRVLSTDDSRRSDPTSVRLRLAEVERALDERVDADERWLCLDVDHWATGRHAPNLARACKEALDAGYQLAISNPAFEVWLLLHFSDEPKPTQAECEAAIRSIIGSYNKARLQPEIYTREAVDLAIARARALDTNRTQRWPQESGSHVYRLVERLPRRV
ncbi:RloB family protein [Paraliomyxa miuraensis]|uniref:RloB family protein n=1 Tax=Paraliomyxa miuraensis TaxID=376150 RepID=UPI002257F4DF|nr:RloB family protein [Paraliomyxa miuraensis]MCX4240273.1 RloB family protein [Paraliomyxa miuraensis]